jgi:hypothetical protein
MMGIAGHEQDREPSAARKGCVRALIAAVLALLAQPAQVSAKPADKPEEYSVEAFTCPLTGTAFKQEVGYSAFPLITMPDGSWLGDTQIGVQIPVCPDDGLVLLPELGQSDGDKLAYHDYTAEERAKLGALMADPEYSALKADGRYAQAYWLATKLGRPGEDRFFMLQRATWATSDPALRRKLVALLAADGEAVIATYTASEALKRLHLVYVASALRELGRFEEAAALLDRIEASGPPVLKPDDPDSLFGPGAFAPELRQAIAEQDDGRFPAAMLPGKMVTDICEEQLKMLYGPTSTATKAACKARRAREAQEANESQAAFDEVANWREKPAERDKACAATPTERRSRGLAMACNSVENARDELAATELVKDGSALAAACAATPENKLEGPLFYGCSSYNIALESALSDAIAIDDAAWTRICQMRGDGYVADMNRHVQMACHQAATKRIDLDKARMLANPAKLDADCVNTPEEQMHGNLYAACLDRKSQLRQAAIDLRVKDPAEFQKRCGQFGKTNSVSNDTYGLSDEQEVCRNAWRLRENTRARAEAEARGLVCGFDVIYSPERPNCVTKAEHERQLAEDRDRAESNVEMQALMRQDDRFDVNSSMSQAARVEAAGIIAGAKAAGTYPKRKPGDLPW